MSNFMTATRYAEYDCFEVGAESEKFRLLSLGTYSGDAGTVRVTRAGKSTILKRKVSRFLGLMIFKVFFSRF